MLGKIFGIMGLIVFMLLYFLAWLYQDIVLRVRSRAATTRRAKRTKAFSSDFTMVLQAIHFLANCDATVESGDSDDEEYSNQNEVSEIADTIAQSERSTTRILVPGPTIRRRDSKEPRVATGECAICLNTYMPGERIVWSSNEACAHVFHLQCMLKWSMNRDEDVSCPCCRQIFIKEVDASPEGAASRNDSTISVDNSV